MKEKEIVGEITIAASMEEVFNYVTNPGTWTKWYPITTGVEWAENGPAQVGQSWREHVRMHVGPLPLWEGVFTWKVVKCDSPVKFVYDGFATGDGIFSWTSGGTAEIVYTFTETAEGTNFHRRLDYKEPNVFLELADDLVFNRIIRHASDEALKNLKRNLEGGC